MAAAMVLLVRSSNGDPPEIPLFKPAATPAASPAARGTPTPKPVVEHRAPLGVLYLLEDVTVPIRHGLKGIVAGTEVRLVGDDGETVRVTDGDYLFTMRKTQLTDDLDIAATARKRTAAIEAANEVCRREQEAVFVRSQHEQIEFLRTHPLVSPTPTPTPTPKK